MSEVDKLKSGDCVVMERTDRGWRVYVARGPVRFEHGFILLGADRFSDLAAAVEAARGLAANNT